MARTYKYTVDCGFTETQRIFYEENGYILFKKLVPEGDIDICHQRFLDVCNGKVKVFTVMRDKTLRDKGETRGEYLVNKIQELLEDDVFYDYYAAHPRVVEVIKNIIGPNVTAIHSMLINKPPHSNTQHSTHPIHQDMFYFPFKPADKIVGSWTAMEKINVENGGLYVLPGTHKGPLFPHGNSEDCSNEFYHGVRGFDHLPKLHLTMDKGDALFFHPHLLHGSSPNMSKNFRKAISVHYADSNCTFINTKGTVQERMAMDFEKLVNEKFGVTWDYINFFKMKSRLISGKPGKIQSMDSHL
ncbi:PREDICTED: phytanoyl-CoA dioxygenase, peroxisomal-like [Nicrophorus vespilloides]|uniref:phytanoyl-CoA dioxygenase n=1 Tax=Nicrophorus vespilloides TaxID=110193 RepID=A0ABM1NJD1_NICVS|nr:PREDICTED: phytanoyl-CoA dioxygenase, peroxisomal-like [Nicrophorus vespilloides]